MKRTQRQMVRKSRRRRRGISHKATKSLFERRKERRPLQERKEVEEIEKIDEKKR